MTSASKFSHDISLPPGLQIGVDTITDADFRIIHTLFKSVPCIKLESTHDLEQIEIAIIDARRLHRWEKLVSRTGQRRILILALVPQRYQRTLPYSYLLNLADDWIFFPLTQQELLIRVILLARRLSAEYLLDTRDNLRLRLAARHHRNVAELFSDFSYSILFDKESPLGCLVDWISESGLTFTRKLGAKVPHPSEWFAPEDHKDYLALLDKATTGAAKSGILRLANGHWARHYFAPIREKDRTVGVLCAVQDIHVQYESSLENIKLKTAIETNNNPVILFEAPSNQVSYANEIGREILQNDSARRYLIRAAQGIGPQDTRQIIIEHQARIYEFQLTLHHSEYFEHRHKISLILADGADVTERLQFEAKLQYLTSHDPLTGLPNRKLFLDVLRDAIHRGTAKSFHIVLFNIVNLKEINETWGHDIADQVLLFISTTLVKDLADSRCFARMGGNEFALILENLDNEAIVTVLQTVSEKFYQGLTTNEHVVPISINFGVSMWPDDAQSASGLLRHAESALRTAHEKGIGQIVFFEEQQNRLARQRMKVLADAKFGLQNGEFVLYYQIQVPTKPNSPLAAEALVRWQHPADGLLGPYIFLDVIENTPLIFELGQFVLKAACSQWNIWRTTKSPVKRIAINLSARQLLQDNFADDFIATLRQHQTPAQAIEVEITETAVVQNVKRAVNHLEKLKSVGINIAIDDFGTGYSSLRLLAELPLDKLKLDKSLVQHVFEHEKAKKLAKAIVDMAKQVDLETIAEGIENRDLAVFFTEIGCDWLQGYWINKPCPADMTETVVNDLKEKMYFQPKKAEK